MAEILIGDVRRRLKDIPSESVNCCVTSPPYFGLRDYGVDGQIGLEATPDAYVAELVAVFREVRRVLRDDGTLWLNLGDSYGSAGGDTFIKGSAGKPAKNPELTKSAKIAESAMAAGKVERETGLRPKNLLGIPWRVAFAMQADGWYLRQDIIWHKPNPMPESVTDRCTKAHEYIFLLSKSARYFYDYEAVKEPANRPEGPGNVKPAKGYGEKFMETRGALHHIGPRETRNKRSVWTITPKPFKGAHFATFPPDLVRPCILAGSPVGGTVLDPFFGAGTTGLVASQLGRSCIGIELNPAYAAIAQERLQTMPQETLALDLVNG